MKHRKNSVARKIQDYFMNEGYKDLINGTYSWGWFAIPNNTEFCVAVEWQNGYDGDDYDKKTYGRFGQQDDDDYYVLNVSIKMTDEFSYNGEYALYAETYYNENEYDDLEGGISLCEDDVRDSFYCISKHLADTFNRFNRMKRKRY